MKPNKSKKNSALSIADAKAYCKHWGIPYWKNKNAYPKSKDTKNEEWRWEFLRRDRKYREAWKKLCIGEFSEVYAEDLIEYGLVELQNPKKSYNELDKKIIFQQYPATKGKNGINEWGYYDINEEQEERVEDILQNEHTDLIEARFNIMQPLSPQIARLRTLLEQKQKKAIGKILRHRVSDDTVLYLRAYDAILVGVDDTTIGGEIFGCPSRPYAATRGRKARQKIKKLWQNF